MPTIKLFMHGTQTMIFADRRDCRKHAKPATQPLHKNASNIP